MTNHTTDSSLTRRQMMGALGGGLGSLGLAGIFTDDASAATGSHFTPKAKRVIHLFMNGGRFQADLFDPKPSLLKYAGQRPTGADLVTERPTGGLLPSPFKFKPSGKSGVPVSELLPRLAERIDDSACFVRCMPTIPITDRPCCR